MTDPTELTGRALRVHREQRSFELHAEPTLAGLRALGQLADSLESQALGLRQVIAQWDGDQVTAAHWDEDSAPLEMIRSISEVTAYILQRQQTVISSITHAVRLKGQQQRAGLD